MSLADIQAIDWKHLDFKKIPQYLLIGFGIALLGILLIILGLIL